MFDTWDFNFCKIDFKDGSAAIIGTDMKLYVKGNNYLENCKSFWLVDFTVKHEKCSYTYNSLRFLDWNEQYSRFSKTLVLCICRLNIHINLYII